MNKIEDTFKKNITQTVFPAEAGIQSARRRQDWQSSKHQYRRLNYVLDARPCALWGSAKPLMGEALREHDS